MHRNLIPYITFTLAILFALPAAAQNCGCADAGNCPADIPVQSNFTVCYDFTDAANNDLADPNQGICGVNISFTHDYIWDLELTLISPAGQEVQLVGPDVDAAGGTLFTAWDVQFVSCAATAEPQGSYEAVWTNDQDWPFVGTIGGSYYPVAGGCLEDFNVGAVNGQWCIEVNNLMTFEGGSLLDFDLELCDESGIFCCDADGGDLDDDLLTCEGDDSLILTLEPEYTNDAPDETLYGYTFLIGEVGGLLLETTENPDLTAYPAGDYEVCGISYDLNEENLVPQPDGALTLQAIKDDLDGLNPSFCAALSEDCFPVTIAAPPPPFALNDTICVGESYVIGDSTFTEAGDYEVVFNSFFDCDSLVNLSLVALPVDTGLITQSICLGDSLTVGDSVFYNTGNYEVYLAGASRCDSTYLVDLTVIPPVTENVATTICSGESYAIGDEMYTATGIYTDTVTSLLTGCDSIVTLDLEVTTVTAEIADPDTITCADPTVILDGTASTDDPGTTYLWTTFAGGNIISPDLTQPTVEINDNGFYQLKVTRDGCADSTAVSVVLLQNIPNAEAGAPDSLTCGVTEIQLDGTASDAGQNLVYEWNSEDGNILPGEENSLTPTVNGAPAFYYLTVTNVQSQCSETDSVFIDLADDAPLADAGADGFLNCAITTVTLDGGASFVDNQHTYIWTNEAGETLPTVDITNAQTDTPGIYTLTVTNTENSCSNTDIAEVFQNLNVPLAEAGETDTLTCAVPEIQLGGAVAGSPDFTVLWTGAGAVQDPTTLTPTVTQSGWYFITATDTDSECSATDSVFIDIAEDLPFADAGPESVSLNCQLTEWALGDPDDTSAGDEYSYAWTLNNTFLSAEFPLTVSETGLYFLTVTNELTGCESTDSIAIFGDLLQPIADAGDDFELNCAETFIILDGEELGELPNEDDSFILYEWYDADYNLLQSGEDSLTVVNPGTYNLVLSESITFCADTATVVITQDPAVPFADAGDDVFADCADGSATLNGSGSAPADFNFLWTSENGQTVINETTPLPTVFGTGIYYLEISNPDGSCSDLDQVEVFLDTMDCEPDVVLTPGFEIFADGENGIIDCTTADQAFIDGVGYFLDTLDASGTVAPGGNISYTWTAPDGIVVNEDNPQFPVVTPGTFVLTVTNTLFDIAASDTISVLNIRNFPTADAGMSTVLNCTNFQNGYILDGTNSDQGADFTYLWTTDFGDFGGSDITAVNPTVFAAGTYELEVTDNSNGCTSTAAVLLSLDGQIPSPCFIDEVQMECIDNAVMIGDTCDVNPDYEYAWNVIENGNIIGSTTGAMITVQTDTSQVSGLFEVVVTDAQNNCTFVDTVEVFTAVNCYPDCVVDALPDTLTCLTEQVFLDGTGSSVGSEYAYEWRRVGGTDGLCGGENTLMPCVDLPGAYLLEITNTQTGFECQSPLVFVTANDSPPDAEIDAADNPAFTCLSDVVTLNATSDDTDAYAFMWENAEGCILTDPTLPAIELDCSGTYSLTVTDLQTGCENISDVQIDYDTLPPAVVNVSPESALIGCNNPQVVLSGSGSSLGQYSWYRDGALLSGANNLTYVANTAGEYCLVVTNPENGCSAEDCATVTADADAVFADAGENQFLTCSVGSVTLTGDAPTGPEFTFQWTTAAGADCFFPPTGSLEITATCPGTYTLNVTDLTSGCTGAASVEVIDATAPPTVDAGPDMELDCDITSVILDASNSTSAGDLTINWVGLDGQSSPSPNGTLTPTATAPGTYSLLIYDNDTDCFATDMVEVFTSADLPTADAGADRTLDCATIQVTLDGSNSSQNDSLSYQWTAENSTGILSANDGLTLLVNAGGNYILTVTNDSTNCMSVDTAAVLLDTLPPLPALTVENDGMINCAAETITLSAENAQPAGLDFLWSTPNGSIISSFTQPQISVNSGGIYNLSLVNPQNGCSADTSVTVTQDFTPPQIEIAAPEELTCIIESVILDATASDDNTDFVWTNANGLPIDNAETATPTVFAAGEYAAEVTSQLNGCTAAATITVTENVTPPVAVAAAEGVLDCLNETVVLTGAGSSDAEVAAYVWTGPTPAADPTALQTTASAPGIYTLTVTNLGNGCTATASTEVIASGLPITELDVTTTDPNCADDASGFIQIDSVIGGNEPYFFSFAGSVFSQYDYRNFLTAGSYEIAVEDADGCTYATTVTLTETESLLIDLGAEIEIESGETVELNVEINNPTAVNTILWRPLPDPDCPGCPQQTFTPTATMTVAVEVRDTLGCTATDNVQIVVTGGEENPLFIPDAFSPNNDGENDGLEIFARSTVTQIESFQIFDRWGNMVHEATDFLPGDPNAIWDGRLHGQEMNPQVFAYRVVYRVRGETRARTDWGDLVLVR